MLRRRYWILLYRVVCGNVSVHQPSYKVNMFIQPYLITVPTYKYTPSRNSTHLIYQFISQIKVINYIKLKI